MPLRKNLRSLQGPGEEELKNLTKKLIANQKLQIAKSKNRKKSTFEKSSKNKMRELDSSLFLVRPGNYMLVEKNEIKRISQETKGLLLGQRIDNDNHVVVLVDEQLILVPFKA